MRSGSFGAAAGAFASHLKTMGSSFTIQLFVACSEDTVKKAADNVPQDELYIVPVILKGRSCYRIGWGVYDSEARAGASLKSLPSYFNQPGVTPRVVQTSTILP
jgi:septal ring-binding cell division protein DamX